MSSENCLSLDLGSKTGYCIFTRGKASPHVLSSGTCRFYDKKNDSFGRRFVKFRNWLITVIETYSIRKCWYEQVYNHKGVYAAHVYGGFLCTLAVICDDYDVELLPVGVGTIKKRVTGNGRASKRDVINAVTRLGLHPVDDNAADAIAIMFSLKEK